MKKKMTVLLLCLLALSACASAPKQDGNDGQVGTESSENPIVEIIMNNDKKIEIELYPEVAPNTVNNFITLIEEGFYNGLTFHRVIPGFMIQGGDPEGTGMGGPGYAIAGEFKENGFDNNLSHTRGVISMARSNNPDSAGSQFFIVVDDSEHLDDAYAGFGKVITGMETVDEIVAVPRTFGDKPVEEHTQIIKSITVNLQGKTYPAPEKVTFPR